MPKRRLSGAAAASRAKRTRETPRRGGRRHDGDDDAVPDRDSGRRAKRDEFVDSGSEDDSDVGQAGRGGGGASRRLSRRGAGLGGSGFLIDDETGAALDSDEGSEAAFAHETADEKRMRLAKQYLEKVRAEEERKAGASAPDALDKLVSQRLTEDVARAAPSKLRDFAARLAGLDLSQDVVPLQRCHHLSVTSVAVSDDDSSIYSGGKDCMLVRWDAETGRRIHVFPGGRKHTDTAVGHRKHILAVACGVGGHLVASGGRDKVIRVWDTRANQQVNVFTGHRDYISGLAFRAGTNELVSCSADRCVKMWNLDEMAYVQTLYGHFSDVSCVDMLGDERAITGSSDRTLRVWKIAQESQLLFADGHRSAVDAVSLMNNEHFASGGTDGRLCLWSARKKRPMASIDAAHGAEDIAGPRWVTAVAACRYTDVLASGSYDGSLRLWRADHGTSLAPLASVPVAGFVNSIAFARSGRFVALGTGQEHRLGRWARLPSGRNGVTLVRMPCGVEDDEQQ